MIPRKKTIIDGMDREILRRLYNSGEKLHLSGSAIAREVKLSPPAIMPRLRNLQNHGIIKPVNTGGYRKFERTFNGNRINIKSPSKIIWGLNLKRK